jgi:protein-disulfide isomerase
MNKYAWMIFGGACVLILGGLIWYSQGAQINVNNVDIQSILPAAKDSGNIADHVYGNPNAKVRIIEYGDFECPGCDAAAPILKALSAKYKNDLAFVFRDFPLSSIHPNARAGAAAAEAAGLQGKFWEYHDMLYDNQSQWDQLSGDDRTNMFVSYAKSLGLDTNKFLSDLNSTAVSNKIDYDIALGNKAGVSGTPSIFVNGKLASQSVKNGQLVPGNNTDPLVWSDQTDFETLVLLPAFKAAGVTVSQ